MNKTDISHKLDTINNSLPNPKRIKEVILSRKLNILRAFVEEMRYSQGDIFIAVQYRRGRAYCRLDKDLNLLYRVEEFSFKDWKIGDFRTITVDKEKNLIIAGQEEGGDISLLILSPEGKTIGRKTLKIKDFPMKEEGKNRNEGLKPIDRRGYLKGLNINNKGEFFAHLPGADYSIYKISSDMKEITPLYDFPQSPSLYHRRVGILDMTKSENLIIGYETNPSIINIFSSNGDKILDKKFNGLPDEIAFSTHLLDISHNPLKDEIYLLQILKDKKKRILIRMNEKGEITGCWAVNPDIRRICMGEENILFASATHFNIMGFILSRSIYGAVTVIEKYELI